MKKLLIGSTFLIKSMVAQSNISAPQFPVVAENCTSLANGLELALENCTFNCSALENELHDVLVNCSMNNTNAFAEDKGANKDEAGMRMRNIIMGLGLGTFGILALYKTIAALLKKYNEAKNQASQDEKSAPQLLLQNRSDKSSRRPVLPPLIVPNNFNIIPPPKDLVVEVEEKAITPKTSLSKIFVTLPDVLYDNSISVVTPSSSPKP